MRTPRSAVVLVCVMIAGILALSRGITTGLPMLPQQQMWGTIAVPALDDGMTDYYMTDIQMLHQDEGWALAGTNVLHYVDGVWTLDPVDVRNSALALAMVTTTSGWLSGSDGELFRYSGGAWEPVKNPLSGPLNVISMVSPTSGWAADGLGGLAELSGTMWTPVISPTGMPIYDIDMVSTSSGWAVGDAGTLLRYDGERWQLAPALGEHALLDIDMLSETSGWIVGGGGALYRLVDGIWRAQPRLTTTTISAIDMLTPDQGWAVGYDFYQYTNGQWRTVQSPHAGCGGGEFLNDIDMVSAEVGWAVGNCGALLRYAGSGLADTDPDRALRSVSLPIALNR